MGASSSARPWLHMASLLVVDPDLLVPDLLRRFLQTVLLTRLAAADD